MSLEFLQRPSVQRYIHDHANLDEKEIVLSEKKIDGVPAKLIAQQISGRRKIKDKIPSFYHMEGFIYPPAINIEQSSSEATGLFKSKLVKGKSLFDLTGGFGVDSFFLSKSFDEVTYVEPNEELLAIARHNHQTLGANTISHTLSDAEEFLKSNSKKVDCIYIDPSRRSGSQKVFRFSDCSPNVADLITLLKKWASTILIKASPLLDIHQGIKELGQVQQVFVVSVENECKELLFIIHPSDEAGLTVEAVDLSSKGEILSTLKFKPEEENSSEVYFNDPLDYLYEPSTSILKAGAFRLIGKKFNLKKIAANTHLYTSESFISDFPGKIFRIESLLKSNPKEVAAILKGNQANITTRNYPLTPAQLKHKLKLKDGGDKFVIGFSGEKKKFLVLAHRIK